VLREDLFAAGEQGRDAGMVALVVGKLNLVPTLDGVVHDFDLWAEGEE
jgi:hypothetical protein